MRLESPEQLIPAEMQKKYNITRWAVTGRDDLGINTDCWGIYDALQKNPSAPDAYWKELCFLWSSDYRTHITENRSNDYRKRLAALSSEVTQGLGALDSEGIAAQEEGRYEVQITRDGNFLNLKTRHCSIKLNCRRGLAIDALRFDSSDGPNLIGTLPHGYYDTITRGADWYSGHTMLGRRLVKPK